MGQIALEDSKRWFPRTAEDIGHTTLALAGEVGEVANIIKKIQRGDVTPKEARTKYDLDMEVADVFTYLILLAAQLRIDLVHVYNIKRIENERRFGGRNGNG